ncbi:zinc-binding alcohol dehydrogenase family protein [Lewinella sp. IMCC34191]|uniref:zinc-binding alcohol dehydrogenase family protein n=1 Tax=Lewinella sp. IMCC34191 TaxID=2259172 RepID=UPI000E276F57|nr:zinc-binding alcohol dehydrogenase family protein [Lewinella sp. IMCC34191]
MKRITCREPGTFVLEEVAAPAPGPGEAHLRIHRVGICGTDLHAFQGNQAFFTYPRVLGHELSASIISIGLNDQGLRAGDPVIIMPYLFCGHCLACRSGKTNCCQNLSVLGVHVDGGMQEEITLDSKYLLSAGTLSEEEIAIVEPLAIGAHALRRGGVTSDDTIAVVGCGPIGIGIMALARTLGCRVIALDTNPARLDFVKQAFGVADTVLANDGAGAQVKSITGGNLATVVFDATGNRRALESGHQYMAYGGRYVLVGLSKDELSFRHPEIHAKETTLLCSRNATREDFEWVRQTLENGEFPTREYITHQVPFPEMIEHFDSWTQPDTGVIKAMVDWTNS